MATRILFPLFGLVALLASECPAKTLTLLPLGDSITEGGGKGASAYRHALDRMLKAAGLDFRFIGPKRDSKGLAHAGYGGWNARRLRAIVGSVYRDHPADVVMLHAGHNNFADQDPVPGVIADTRVIIQTIQEINPKVVILLAQVIPAGKLPKYSYIPDLNIELAKLAHELSESGLKLHLVNQAAGFDWKTDTTADKVHPNAQGATKIARQWFTVLKSLQRLPQ